MLGKSPYPTLNQFVNALRGFDIREDEEEVPQKNHNMAFSTQRGSGRGNYSKKKETITSIQKKVASNQLDKEHVLIIVEMDQVTILQVEVM